MAKTFGDYFLRGLEQGQERGSKAAQEAQSAQQKADLENWLMGKKIGAVEDLRAKYPEQDVGAEGVYIREKDKLGNYLKGKQIENLQEEREARRVKDVEDRSTKAGTAQMIPAMSRVENVIPGLFKPQMGPDGKPIDPKLKSAGGLKGYVPNWAVPAAEFIGQNPIAQKMGIGMEKGATEERQALQELANIKIYDSSGKQINEKEMARITQALGLKGYSDPKAIIDALRQMGYTVQQKQQQVSAGADPEALKTFRERGGLAGYNSLPELMNAGVGNQPSVGAPPVDMQKQAELKRLEELRNKARGN